ncbi:hypothetical protein FRC03_006707 [Tulasnella sp. 419]|nr:hypothetical protein FRC03_006707 [Tulasnella sp. 419]
MPAPPQVNFALKRKYPNPTVDQAWLDACYEWVIEDSGLTIGTVNAEVIAKIDLQLLQSDLDDSMVAGTGLPQNIDELHDIRIGTGPQGAIMCQINAMTEIGHSAFSLQNVRQTRIDRADLAGLVEAGVEDEEENAPIPKYPRSTLRFVLSDGSISMRAMEYKRLPGLQLGETPMGCKLLLKNVLVRRGIAFLEPEGVTILESSRTEEREEVQDADFARGLRLRMGLPDVEPEASLAPGPSDLRDAPTAPPPTPPVQPPNARAPPVQSQRVARAEIDDSFDDDFTGDDDIFAEIDAIEKKHTSQQTPQIPAKEEKPVNRKGGQEDVIEIDSDDSEVRMVNTERLGTTKKSAILSQYDDDIIEISD